jgi:DNA-binding NtrC family response regulator
VATALVIDDDREMCWVLAAALAGCDWRTAIANTGREAMRLVTRRRYPVAFVDARLPDISGLDLAAELLRIRPETRIVMISGYYFADDEAIAEALKQARICAFLAKPFDLDAIVATLS